ncbi:MAG: hypothetical protein GY853_01940 [PVC group bacterium]|nr:hypothetical protein [PVC group bacterium]
MNKTILYLTDNSLDYEIAAFCRDKLFEAAGDIPVICVSQKSISSTWLNLCVGDIGSSWNSLYQQMYTGLEHCKTEYVGIAEHDCLYTPEHFLFTPTEDKFFYNKNHWLYDWGTKVYYRIYFRKAMSQLICKTQILKEYTKGVLELLEKGLFIKSGLRWYGEPGLYINKYRNYIKRSGITGELKKDFVSHINKYESSLFETDSPNVDIRHGDNFTGKKRGEEHCEKIPYWGKL